MTDLVDRYSKLRWLLSGSALALVASVAVVPLVGTYEIVASVVASVAALGGSAAALWKHRLDKLPLQFAPNLAEWEGPLAHHLTMRAWLGRGRRIDALQIRVESEGKTLEIVAPQAPVLGCFHAVFPAVTGAITVRIEGRSGQRRFSAENVFAPDARSAGRFRPGFEIMDGWRWKRDQWSRVG